MLFALIYLRYCVWIGRTFHMNWQGKAYIWSSPLDISHHKHNNMIYYGYCTFGGCIPTVLPNGIRISWVMGQHNISKWNNVWKIKISIASNLKTVFSWWYWFRMYLIILIKRLSIKNTNFVTIWLSKIKRNPFQ